jgi:hypothetical protein
MNSPTFTPGQSVYVKWYGKTLQGSIVPNDTTDALLASMVAVSIPLMGLHPVALFTPGHVYDTADETDNLQSVQKIAKSVPEIEENVPKYSQSVPTNSETSKCEAFKKAHWDNERNHLQIEALEEFYSLWRKEHAPVGYTDKPCSVGRSSTLASVLTTMNTAKPQPKKKKQIEQLSLFD